MAMGTEQRPTGRNKVGQLRVGLEKIIMKKDIQQQLGIKGVIKASVFDTSSPEANRLEAKILDLIQNRSAFSNAAEYRARYKELVSEMRRLFLVREQVHHNIVVTAGRAELANRITGTAGNNTVIDDGALGTSTTSPSNSDTTLGSEVFRKVKASESTTDNIAFIDWFYSKSDTNGTYEEFGSFINGSGTGNPDTGSLFTHLLTGGWTKTSSESMTVAAQYTFN